MLKSVQQKNQEPPSQSIEVEDMLFDDIVADIAPTDDRFTPSPSPTNDDATINILLAADPNNNIIAADEFIEEESIAATSLVTNDSIAAPSPAQSPEVMAAMKLIAEEVIAKAVNALFEEVADRVLAEPENLQDSEQVEEQPVDFADSPVDEEIIADPIPNTLQPVTTLPPAITGVPTHEALSLELITESVIASTSATLIAATPPNVSVDDLITVEQDKDIEEVLADDSHPSTDPSSIGPSLSTDLKPKEKSLLLTLKYKLLKNMMM